MPDNRMQDARSRAAAIDPNRPNPTPRASETKVNSNTERPGGVWKDEVFIVCRAGECVGAKVELLLPGQSRPTYSGYLDLKGRARIGDLESDKQYQLKVTPKDSTVPKFTIEPVQTGQSYVLAP